VGGKDKAVVPGYPELSKGSIMLPNILRDEMANCGLEDNITRGISRWVENLTGYHLAKQRKTHMRSPG
jgi:hypothetical protein